MNPIDFTSLPLSSKAIICWGFAWRGMVITLASALCGAVLGGIGGFICGFIGVPGAAAIIGGVLGLGCGVFSLYLLIQWLLSSRMGSFRLVVISAEDKQ